MVHLGSKLTQFTVLSFKSNNHIFQIAHSHLFLQRHSSGENQRMLSPEKNLILQGNNIIKVKKNPEDGGKVKATWQGLTVKYIREIMQLFKPPK